MTREKLKETIIDYVIDTYSLNKDRNVVSNHVDEWMDCRQQVKSVDLADVGNWKPDETLDLLSEIIEKVKVANEEVDNGIYDPMFECAKHIHNNYKITKR